MSFWGIHREHILSRTEIIRPKYLPVVRFQRKIVIQFLSDLFFREKDEKEPLPFVSRYSLSIPPAAGIPLKMPAFFLLCRQSTVRKNSTRYGPRSLSDKPSGQDQRDWSPTRI